MKNTDYLVLVNGEVALPDGFEDSVPFLSVEKAGGEQCQIEEKTYAAFLRLKADLLETEGMEIQLLGAGRTRAQQAAIFDNYRDKFGLSYAEKYAAKPGHSEHHTGLAIDVGIVVNGKLHYTIEDMLAVVHLFEIIHKRLPKYGFLLRYPKGKEDVTKIGYEPWHFRYIDSPEIAKKITDQGICFEEYLP